MSEYPENIELVLIYKIDDDDVEHFTEKVNAKKVGDYYQILSIPAFAKNLAYGDIVKVESEDEEFHFAEFIKESGHSVIHIVIFNLAEKENLIANLKGFGCGVNIDVSDNYLVIDVPALTNYSNFKKYLDQQQLQNIIDYSESCLSYIHRQFSSS